MFKRLRRLLPARAIREQIVSAIDLIVHTSRFSDGTRKVTHVTEITGMDEHGSVLFSDIFRYRQRGLGQHDEAVGDFKPTGHLPSFLDELKARGAPIDEAMFRP